MRWVIPKLISLAGLDECQMVTCCSGDTGFSCFGGS
jgi:hypothetical protein